MKRRATILSVLSCLVILGVTLSVFAQQPAAPAAGAAARPAPQPIPLFFREGWKNTPALVPMAQAYVSNADLEVNMHGAGKEDFNVTTESNIPHIWTGLCTSSCALSLRNKDNYVDLSGKAKMKWLTKTSGFHEIRPVVKLADGTWLIGDHVDAYTYDYHESEFYFADIRWMKIDMDKVNTKGTLLDKVDLSKVDEVGFADLTPGSGHGTGGYSDVAWIEVYGKPLNRSAVAQPKGTN